VAKLGRSVRIGKRGTAEKGDIAMPVDSAIVEVIVGLVFIYSLLSILVTQINAVVASVLRLRAGHLRNGISELVHDPTIRAKILTHPLIRLVQGDMTLPDQRVTDEQAHEIAKGKLNNVAWINSKTFVNVLINVVRVDSDNELFAALLNIIDGMPANQDRRKLRLIVNQIISSGEGLEELRTTIAQLGEPIYREALTEALDQIDDEIGRLGLEPNSIISLMAGLRNVKNQYLRNALETVLATSKTLDEAEHQLAEWFDEGMARVTEAFKSTMMAISIFVAILIAVILNVDSVNIALSLWNDPALRSLVAEAAERADTTALQAQVEEAQAAIEMVEPDPNDPNATPTPTPVQQVRRSGENALNTVNTLLTLRLPLGWRWTDLSGLKSADSTIDTTSQPLFGDANNLWNFFPGNSPYWASLIGGKIVGLFLTVIAIAQGAPFWFNLLKRFTGGKE
jgi:hypothetical protein